MGDIFDNRGVKPMLIGVSKSEAFDSDDYIFEVKFDGIRALAYLDKDNADIRNKRNKKVDIIYPELGKINLQAKERCIIDGEVVILVNGNPDFEKIQRRSLMTNAFRIQLAAKQYPVSFVAYDIVYYRNKEINHLPLMERKKILEDVLIPNDSIAISKYISGIGKPLFDLTVENNLEGIVAKLKDSKYIYGKETNSWIKIKNLQDAEFYICGYDKTDTPKTSLTLGEFVDGRYNFIGHVDLYKSNNAYKIVSATQAVNKNKYYINFPDFNDRDTIWIVPDKMCTVKFMNRTKNGGFRQPGFKSLYYKDA
ncbi:MAG TPA: hypothetical protein DCM73_08230 [Clostridiales bacterium]|nr:hypothetical protein [Clostridiales bacterium]